MEKQSDSPVSSPPSPARNADAAAVDKEKISEPRPSSSSSPTQALAQSPQQQQACKSEDYRKLFHLPQEEILVQDFNCAFQKKILLQGHMYLFEQYICFYSNIFGYEKKKVLPLKDVAFVRKAWTAGLFPNAIEIGAWGKKYVFASFLSRDEAYRLIVNGWTRHSGHARTTSSSELQLSHSLTPTTARNSDFVEQASNYAEDGDEKQVLPKSEENVVQSELPDTEKSDLIWKIEDVAPPPLSSEFKTLMETEFPVDVEDFFELFFSDNANSFAEIFHKRCSDEEFRSTFWAPHPHFGYVRDITFRHPVNLYFGPKSALCSETQRFRVYRNSHLVIETSQQMSEIPYADYFHVEVRWDVERVSKEVSFHSCVRISMNVNFSKKTLWRSKIEQGTLDECKETYSIWVREAYNVLSSKANRNNSGMVELSRPDSNTLTEAGKEGEASSSITEDSVMRRDLVRRKRSVTATINYGLHKFRMMVLRFCSENPMVLVVLLIAIVAILTQAATLTSILHKSQLHHSQHFQGPEIGGRCLGGPGAGSEAISWLEQRARYVKEEMSLAEARLQSLHQDLSLLKLHMNLFEQLKTK